MIIDKNTKAGIGILESGPIKIINKVKLHDEKENKGINIKASKSKPAVILKI